MFTGQFQGFDEVLAILLTVEESGCVRGHMVWKAVRDSAQNQINERIHTRHCMREDTKQFIDDMDRESLPRKVFDMPEIQFFQVQLYSDANTEWVIVMKWAALGLTEMRWRIVIRNTEFFWFNLLQPELHPSGMVDKIVETIVFLKHDEQLDTLWQD
jgi:hypothetical protein